MQGFLGDLRYRQQEVWRQAGALYKSPRGEQESSDLPSLAQRKKKKSLRRPGAACIKERFLN
eukprot:445212-Pelagomonas_calceolata.AAC.1